MPLYKGSAVYQYEFNYASQFVNRYVDSYPFCSKNSKTGFPFQNICYKNYRLVIRTIASNTNERSLISAVIPKNHFISNNLYGVHIESDKASHGTLKTISQSDFNPPDQKIEKETGKQKKEVEVKPSFFEVKSLKASQLKQLEFKSELPTKKEPSLKTKSKQSDTSGLSEKPEQSKNQNHKYMLLLQAFLNSFTVDYFIRKKVSANINKKYITPLCIPRLTEKDPYFKGLVERSAKLTCIGKEFDELADEIGIPRGGVKDEQKRWKIQGEIDAIVAYVYGLTLDEFSYILSTFTTRKNQERLKALKKYALEAFKKDKILDKTG